MPLEQMMARPFTGTHDESKTDVVEQYGADPEQDVGQAGKAL